MLMRAFLGLACSAILAGCITSPDASPPPSAGRGTIDPSGSVAPASTTVAPNASLVLPGASPVACVAFDLTRETLPFVVLRFADKPADDVRAGLGGSYRLGDAHLDTGDWHQPSPESALAVARDQSLIVLAYLGDDDVPTCLDGVTVEAAPFSPLAHAPESAARRLLAESGTQDPSTGVIAFRAPMAAGEWVVRVSMAFDTNPGRSRQDTFYRLRVDTPPPAVDGRAIEQVTCAVPGESPPGVFLSPDGGASILGEGGAFTWGTLAGEADQPFGPLVEAPMGARLRVRIGGDVCAGWWRIQLAPRPPDEGRNQAPITDLVPDTIATYYANPPGQANQFELAPIPAGDWVVQAHLRFGSEANELVGQTSSYWNVVVR